MGQTLLATHDLVEEMCRCTRDLGKPAIWEHGIGLARAPERQHPDATETSCLCRLH